jgi:hypothetical protein
MLLCCTSQKYSSTVLSARAQQTADVLLLQEISTEATTFAHRRRSSLVTKDGAVVMVVEQHRRAERADSQESWHRRLLKRMSSWRWWTSVNDQFTGVHFDATAMLALDASTWQVSTAFLEMPSLLASRRVQCNNSCCCCAGQVIIKEHDRAFHPLCPLSRAWNTVMLINMAYLFVALPLQAGFALTNRLYTGVRTLTTVLFFLDIAGSFITGHQVGKTLDHVELELRKVMRHYVQTWLLYDVLFSVPWRTVIPAIAPNHWITATPECINAVPLVSLLRSATLKKRSSYVSLDMLHVKYTTRAIITFAIFLAVRKNNSRAFDIVMTLLPLCQF